MIWESGIYALDIPEIESIRINREDVLGEQDGIWQLGIKIQLDTYKFMLPKISIQLKNGGIGGVLPNEDSISGLIMGCDAISGITHKTPFTINSLPELADRITNNAENTALYKEVAAFYNKASVGMTLHIITFPNTKKLSEETNINAAGLCPD